jgi:hypothetical protein
MKGSQVNVFLLPQDTVEMERQLRRRVPFVGARALEPDGRALRIESLAVEEMGKTRLRVYLLPEWLAARADLYSTEERSGDQIDPGVMPLVEFDRCYHEPGLLRRGRFYGVESASALNREPVEVQLRYRQWLKDLISVVRRTLVRLDTGLYIGDHALQAYKAGLRLAEL